MTEKKDLETTKSANLIVTEAFDLSLLENMDEAMAEEMEGLKASFDSVKIPSGGGIIFEIPSEDPDEPDMAKEIFGVIVDKHPVNAYYKEKYSGENNPPDCCALDAENGIGDPGGSCAHCPLNQWGSAPATERGPSKGKACKNRYRIYLLRSATTFPLRLTLPPTSLNNLSNYIAKRVLGKGYRGDEVITKIFLRKAISKDGPPYSQVFFQVAGSLSPEQKEIIKSYSVGIKKQTRALDVQSDEFADSESKGDAFEDSDLPL